MKRFLMLAALIAAAGSAQAQQSVTLGDRTYTLPEDATRDGYSLAVIDGRVYTRDTRGTFWDERHIAQKGCTLEWLFGCTAIEKAQEAEWEAVAAAAAKTEAYLASVAKQDERDAEARAVALSCRAESITYFQYTGCIQVYYASKSH